MLFEESIKLYKTCLYKYLQDTGMVQAVRATAALSPPHLEANGQPSLK